MFAYIYISYYCLTLDVIKLLTFPFYFLCLSKADNVLDEANKVESVKEPNAEVLPCCLPV